jgi:hypothetical protein
MDRIFEETRQNEERAALDFAGNAGSKPRTANFRGLMLGEGPGVNAVIIGPGVEWFCTSFTPI